MKIQCSVCEAVEANVMCCADEAALCWSCDEKVHGANKLASKHQRVRLTSSSSKMPKCDICQEMVGYFFCLEDRAFLCRECDVAVHTANDIVSVHQRFMLTGVRICTEPTAEAGPSFTSGSVSKRPSRSSLVSAVAGKVPPLLPKQRDADAGGVPQARLLHSTGSSSSTHFYDLVGLQEFDTGYPFIDNTIRKCKDDYSPITGSVEDEIDECFCKVPDIPWATPQMPCFWMKSNGTVGEADGAVPVPDVSYFPTEGASHFQQSVQQPSTRGQCYFQ